MLNKTNKKNKSNISGKNIRRIRKKNHLSQEDLAAKLQLVGAGVTTSTISKIETQDRRVSDKELLCIAKALGTSTEDLVNSKDDYN